MLTVYLLILSETLPATGKYNKTFGERIVTDVFYGSILITLSTILLQLFTSDEVKSYKIPYVYQILY